MAYMHDETLSRAKATLDRIEKVIFGECTGDELTESERLTLAYEIGVAKTLLSRVEPVAGTQSFRRVEIPTTRNWPPMKLESYPFDDYEEVRISETV